MIGSFLPVSNRLRRVLPVTALILAFGLAGCATPPKPDLHPTAQETAFIPPNALIPMSDGARIPLRLYQPSSPPRAVILALHGFGDSRDAWEVMAPSFSSAGIVLVAPDIRGFGSTTDRSGWSNTPRLIADTQEEIIWVRAQYPGLPVYLMGESMGGAIALLSASTRSSEIAGAILLAPAVVTIGEPWQTLLAGIDSIAPKWTLDGSDVPGHRIATDNLAALRRMYFDPLTLHASAIHPLYGLTLLMRDAFRAAPHLSTPTLLVFGGRDQFVLPRYTAALIQRLPPSVRLDEIPRAHHLITRDRTSAARDIVSWIDTPSLPLPSGGDVSAALWVATASND